MCICCFATIDSSGTMLFLSMSCFDGMIEYEYIISKTVEYFIYNFKY